MQHRNPDLVPVIGHGPKNVLPYPFGIIASKTASFCPLVLYPIFYCFDCALAEVICQGAAAALCAWNWALHLAEEPNEVLMDTCILNCMTSGDWAKAVRPRWVVQKR